MQHLQVNPTQLDHIFQTHLDHKPHIPYRLGGKAPNLRALPEQLTRGIDCSGEVRLLLSQSSVNHTDIGDGSWLQREWFEQNGFEEVPYESTFYSDANAVYIAFITANIH